MAENDTSNAGKAIPPVPETAAPVPATLDRKPDALADALASLRAVRPDPAAVASDDTAGILARMRAATSGAASSGGEEQSRTLATLRVSGAAVDPEADDATRALSALRASQADAPAPIDDTAGPLAALRASGPSVAAEADPLSDLIPLTKGEATATDVLQAIVAALREPQDGAELDGTDDAQSDPLADLLADFGDSVDAPGAGDDLDALLAAIDAGTDAEADAEPMPESNQDNDPPESAPEPSETDLEALLANLDRQVAEAQSDTSDPADGPPTPVVAKPRPARTDVEPFGTLTAEEPSIGALARPEFRIAIFGDFSGRASRGVIEIGDDLACRRAIALDVDTLDTVIAGFATDLVLPVGADGQAIVLHPGGLDDLHPDALVDNLEVFEALKGLRARLSNASTAASAVRDMQGWGANFTDHPTPAHSRSGGTSIPADRRLNDFERLVGGGAGRLTQASPVDGMIARIVGPHLVPGPNPEAEALKTTVDAAMTSAMRLVLHHPEFQSIESAWRSLDLIARRVETDRKLQISLYDVSAEEIAADIAATPDLSQSGLYRLLMDPVEEEGAVPYSALFGLYTFEETPPHAELLARVSQIAAHVRAPFVTALGPAFLEVEEKNRHPLTARAWDRLRGTPAAAYLGLASPRFLLRQPYGRKSDPIDAFRFEEFSEAEGLSGLLWANPAVLVAILMAQTWTQTGAKMDLGTIMSQGDIPVYVVTDRHGDQVALPCTERNLTESRTRLALARGTMPVVSIKGRDVVRLASFQSLSGDILAGPWTDAPPVLRAAASNARRPDVEVEMPTGTEDDLDALLAGFSDIPIPVDSDGIDAELAALLEGL